MVESPYVDPVDLASLGNLLATEGVGRHEEALDALATQARRYAPGAATALSDRTLPEVVRLRAFAVVARVLARPGHANEDGDGHGKEKRSVVGTVAG